MVTDLLAPKWLLRQSQAGRHNFTASEISVLTVKVDENLSVLQSKLTNSNIREKIEYGVKLLMA